MKNQYFGDINDYRKYGLLRILCGTSDVTLAICWMLTTDDGSSMGQSRDYLVQPERFRHYDPYLYDSLIDMDILTKIENRNVSQARRFFSEEFLSFEKIVTDYSETREILFEKFFNEVKGFDLIFFDPDIGMEIRSVPYGRRNSAKYLYWKELKRAFQNGHSAIIYQHFPRKDRVEFINNMTNDFRKRIGVQNILSFRTANVVFFLLSQERHAEFFHKKSERISTQWRGQIEVFQFDTPILPPPLIPPQPPPETSVTVEKLDEWRRFIIRLINKLDQTPVPGEGLKSRITKLSREGIIPRDISALIIVITEARNEAVYRGHLPVGSKAKAVWTAWEAVGQWAPDLKV